MLRVSREPPSGTPAPETGLPVPNPARAEALLATRWSSDGYGRPDVAAATTKGWGLKLAVLLVVAVLCIAFAGLLWALIF